MNPLTPAEIVQVQVDADLLHSREDVEQAMDQMASQITGKLADKYPVILCVMTGGAVPTGILLPKLAFPLELDYVHATRYRGKTSGRDIHWQKKPGPGIRGRCVLIIDDILDQGITISAIIEECKKQHASEIYTAVLVDKQVDRPDGLERANFTGLTVPDRYVFGYGMDYRGQLRNASGIYAVKGL